MDWPISFAQLEDEQRALGAAKPSRWRPPTEPFSVGGCFICFPRGKSGYGERGDPAWAGAALRGREESLETAVVAGPAGARYEAGLLALREGPLLEAAVRCLSRLPDLLLVNATGRDHPRRAGLALHLGALLGVPSVGVTHRPLLAHGEWPEPTRGSRSPLTLENELVGYWLSIRDGTRPLAVHAAWRTDPESACELVLAATGRRARTPEPIRQARRVARAARTAAARALG